MKRVVSFGEIMLRLSPPATERFFQSPQLRTYFGGSEANVAVSLAHFGVPSDYVTRVPDNAIGEAAVAALRAEGVGVRHVLRGGSRLGIYFVESGADLRGMRVVYDRAGSAFSELAGDEIPWDDVLKGAGWLHLSGITPALGAGPAASARTAAETARQLGATVSLDLNYRPALWRDRDPVPVIRPLAACADVLIGNAGAVKAMLGVDADASAGKGRLQELSDRLRKELGCSQVALTDREVVSSSEHAWCARLFSEGTSHEAQRYQVRVVDRVGGGDSFAAALVYALLAGRTAREALDFATAASALKLTIPGDFNRVTVDEVDRLLQTNG